MNEQNQEDLPSFNVKYDGKEEIQVLNCHQECLRAVVMVGRHAQSIEENAQEDAILEPIRRCDLQEALLEV